jgi:uncharacterized MAPEG superfamily protein
MNIFRFLTRENFIVAFVALVILFVLYGNKSMVNDWAEIIGIKWIWVPIVVIFLRLYSTDGFTSGRKTDRLDFK